MMSASQTMPCTDYCSLHKITLKTCYPLPLILAALDVPVSDLNTPDIVITQLMHLQLISSHHEHNKVHTPSLNVKRTHICLPRDLPGSNLLQ